MKYVKLFENWMEDEDGDQTSYVDAPIAHADMHVGDEESEEEFAPETEEASDEEIYADGIGYDDSEVEEEEEMEEEEE